MVVSIRSDCCIALRMIALQAWYASEQELWEIEMGFWQNEKIEKQEAEILHLRAENEKLLRRIHLFKNTRNEQVFEKLMKANEEIERLRFENETLKEIAVRETMKVATLRAALKPFADCEVWEGYKGYERFVAGMFHIHNKGMDSLNISHIRAARAAYLGEKE